MSICRYFQQGTCRFGSRCRYEHTYTTGGGGGGGVYASNEGTSGTSIFNRNKPEGQYAPSQSTFFSQAVPVQVQSRPSVQATDMRDLMQMVMTELLQSERSGQWPLSCFAPFKEQACFPGLEDHSCEEIRFLMYEAVHTGDLDARTRKVKEMYERSGVVKKQILNPTPEVYSIIEKLFKGEKIEFTSSSIFAPQIAVASNTMLTQNPAVTSSFTFSLSSGGDGNVPNNFGSQSVFGNANAGITHSSSIFAMPAQNTQTTNQSIFVVENQPSVAPASPFGNVVQTNPVFQQSSGSFNSPLLSEQGKGLFGGSVMNQNKSIFGGDNTGQSKGIFGGSATHWNQTDKAVSEDTVYTKLTDLTEDEKNIFTSKTFTMGKVPINAPAKELCM